VLPKLALRRLILPTILMVPLKWPALSNGRKAYPGKDFHLHLVARFLIVFLDLRRFSLKREFIGN
jgi:hypothetical protein